MKGVNRDRALLKRLVESYGKEDVSKYVRHLNEYELGGFDWGDPIYPQNYYAKYGLDNQDEIPFNVMEYLWFIGKYAVEFRTILTQGLDPKQSKYRDVQGMSIDEIEYWDKVVDPIAGLMSNKTNIKDDEHQITREDILDYVDVYQKLRTCPVSSLQNASRVLMAFVNEIKNGEVEGGVENDRAALESLVSAYGKKDVTNYVNHLDENIFRDAGAAYRRTFDKEGIESSIKEIKALVMDYTGRKLDLMAQTWSIASWMDEALSENGMNSLEFYHLLQSYDNILHEIGNLALYTKKGYNMTSKLNSFEQQLNQMLDTIETVVTRAQELANEGRASILA
jgi:hypothetical protein